MGHINSVTFFCRSQIGHKQIYAEGNQYAFASCRRHKYIVYIKRKRAKEKANK